ncbi:MAG: DEAD/DEAH box helicase family protein [Geobacteraceae bacterium]|nr:DEAD/DEAH box helicase family protein [Geobacteraceae bacterium]
MKKIKLLGFQQQTSEEAVHKIASFNYGLGCKPDGTPYPSVVFIQAITGAGKTAILSKISSCFKDSIILWTTPPSAVVSQTVESLNNQYAEILGNINVIAWENDLKVSNFEWNKLINDETGTTIVVCTVGTYNIENKGGRRIHQDGNWEELCEKRKRRDLVIVYDEGHNLTKQQSTILMELKPRCILLASGSSYNLDGISVIIQNNGNDLKDIVKSNTALVDTPQVVAAGLLKKRVDIADCDIDRKTILIKAVEQRKHLEQLVIKNELRNVPIACYIVNSTKDGLEIWDILTEIGVKPSDIAVHLSGASRVANLDTEVDREGLIDTHTEKLKPEEIRNHGFRHIIWNKALKEGWDEPWAFVAYVDGVNYSVTDIEQKIGRFIRNPFRDEDGYPETPGDEELQASYFFLNHDNDKFTELLNALKNNLQAKYPGLIEITSGKREYVELQPRKDIPIPKIQIRPIRKKINRLLLDCLRTPNADDTKSIGVLRVDAVNLETNSIHNRKIEHYCDIVQTTIRKIVEDYVRNGDRRLLSRIDDETWCSDVMKIPIAYSSKAYNAVVADVMTFLNKAPDCLSLHVNHRPEDAWHTCTVKVKISDDSRTNAKRYTVHAKNALHDKYDNLNEFENKVAIALSDKSDCTWMRNPAKSGYGIDLLKPLGGNVQFYPDFIVFIDGKVVFLEPKGAHLLTDALITKNLNIPDEKFEVYILVEDKEGSGLTVHTAENSQYCSGLDKAFTWIFKT